VKYTELHGLFDTEEASVEREKFEICIEGKVERNKSLFFLFLGVEKVSF